MQTQRGSTSNSIPHRGPRRKEVQPLYYGMPIPMDSYTLAVRVRKSHLYDCPTATMRLLWLGYYGITHYGSLPLLN